MTSIYLQKDDQRLPDTYGIKIEFITGKIIDYKVASHKFLSDLRCIEIITFDNECVVIPLDNIMLSFDKEFTKIIELKQEFEKNRGNNDNSI